MTLAEIEDAAAEAVAVAAADLEARGIDPAACPRLLGALEHGIEQTAIALHASSDVTGYRGFVDAVYVELQRRPLLDKPPMIPKRTLSRRLLDD